MSTEENNYEHDAEEIKRADPKISEEAKYSFEDYSANTEAPRYGPVSSENSGRGEDLAGKIFIGGLSWQTTLEGLKTYFELFGELKDAALMTDKRTGTPKGFGFVTFKNPEGNYLDNFLKLISSTNLLELTIFLIFCSFVAKIK